jgi:hypothetical protein
VEQLFVAEASTTSALTWMLAAPSLAVPMSRCSGRIPATSFRPIVGPTDSRRRGGSGTLKSAPSRVEPSPLPINDTSMKFIAGLPMKPATNRLTGVS